MKEFIFECYLYILGPFHPYIDINRKMFVELTVLETSQAAGVSPLRVQEARIDHDDDNIYVTATLMDKPPFLGRYHFNMMISVSQQH